MSPSSLPEPTPSLTPAKVAASQPTTDPPASDSPQMIPALPLQFAELAAAPSSGKRKAEVGNAPSTKDPSDITETVPSPPTARQLPQIEDPQPNAGPSENIDPREIEMISNVYRQFRVLIVGRANSGKTTIIQRMCNTNEEPAVYDENWNRQPASVLNDPNPLRGFHNIRLQIIFQSNPNFVFHNSMGFESGSHDEVETVKDFIKEMLAKSELQDRLHMIWFCVPTDSNSVAFKAELSFFQQSTGGIPVIAVFTKWDGQIIDAYNTLRRRDDMDRRQALLEAPLRARKVLEEEYIPVFKNTPFPPVSYTVLGDMDNPETKCGELIERTAAALNDKVLKKLFVSVQTHNLELCIRNGINEAVCKHMFPRSPFKGPNAEMVIQVVVSWFPHFYIDNYVHEQNRYRRYLLQHIVTPLHPLVSRSKKAFSSRRLQVLFVAAGTAIIATRSFNMKQRTEGVNIATKASAEEYLASSQYDGVKTAIIAKFRQYTGFSALRVSWSTLEKISAELQQICLNNLLH